MNTIECIKTRRSVRSYTEQPIEREVIEKIAEAASYAPSWKNSQTIRYWIVSDHEKIKKIADEGVCGFEFNANTLKRCTMLAVQTVVTGTCGYEPDGSFSTNKEDGWEMYDAGVSAQTFCLAAHEYGVGTVIMGLIDDEKISQILGIPETETVSSLIAMEYPSEERPAPGRKTVGELVRFDF